MYVTVPPVKKKSPPLSTKSMTNKSSSGSQNLTDSFQFPVVPDDEESNSNGSSDKDETNQPPATPTTPQAS